MTALLDREVPWSVPEATPVLRPVPAQTPDAQLSLDDLGARIAGMAGRIAAATARWLALVAEFDRREGFARMGLGSTARWLSFACGISHRTAVEHVRVARALTAFPRLAQAMGTGAMSYSHARAITRLARPGESGLVDDLIELARHATIGQLEETVRGLRTVEDNLADDGTPRRPEQYLSHGWTTESQWRCQARLDPEKGAIVQGCLETIARGEQISPAEALVRMAEIALAAVNDSGTAPRVLRGDERAAVVVHVDAATIPPESSAPGESSFPGEAGPSDPGRDEPRSIERAHPVGRIEGGPGLLSAAVMRLMCSGRIRTMTHAHNGSPLDLGRSKRTVSVKQFRALLMRDGGCTHPGCGSRSGLEAHHVRHWLYGGRTDLKNLVLLCLRHHHAHHDGEFSIAIGPGRAFRFFRSDGRLLEAHIDPARLIDTAVPVEDAHVSVADDAARGLWCGDRLDCGYAVAVLAGRRGRGVAPRGT